MRKKTPFLTFTLFGGRKNVLDNGKMKFSVSYRVPSNGRVGQQENPICRVWPLKSERSVGTAADLFLLEVTLAHVNFNLVELEIKERSPS